MQFSELEYPIAPFMRRELLGEAKIPGYSCLIYKCPDTPHLLARINGRDFVIRVGSVFQTIIDTVGIKPDENYVGNDAKGRVEDGP